MVVSAALAAVLAAVLLGVPQVVDLLPRLAGEPVSSGIANPENSVAPVPDYTAVCTAPGVLDESAGCLNAALDAIDHARALEGVRPMVLPAGFAAMSVTRQLFVAINLERVDRGLPPFFRLSLALDMVARRGALAGGDPPSPGKGFRATDGEWVGGAVNGLDADYLLMYDDGAESPNLNCTGGSGCWSHREGIVANYGSGILEMGAAFVADSGGSGDSLAISMAAAAR